MQTIGIKWYHTPTDEKTMVKIGSVCPLFFHPLKYKFGKDINYLQRFHASDKILMQILSDDGEKPIVTLRNEISGISNEISLSEYNFNSFITLYYFSLSGLTDSVYSVSIDRIGVSEPFSISSSDMLLDETSLIKYSHKDNNSIDNVFWIGKEQQIFEIRYECGFKPSGITLKAEVEQFRNKDQEIIGLYSVPYKTMLLTAGSATGIPYWFAEHLNKILCLSLVSIEGVEYVRSEGNSVDLSSVMDDSQMFFFSALLEQRYNEVHGIGGEVQPPSSSGNAGLSLTNPQDGEVMVYDGRTGSIVNVNML